MERSEQSPWSLVNTVFVMALYGSLVKAAEMI